MKLIKINNSHFVIISGEIAGFTYNKPTYNSDSRIGLSENNQSKKITHSTQPLEGVLPLDLSEVKALIGEVDVKKLATQEYNTCTAKIPVPTSMWYREEEVYKMFYTKGYKQCLEDNKEKKYTEADLKEAFEAGQLYGDNWCRFFNTDSISKSEAEKTDDFESHIKSLQPKTEWGCCISNGKLVIL